MVELDHFKTLSEEVDSHFANKEAYKGASVPLKQLRNALSRAATSADSGDAGVLMVVQALWTRILKASRGGGWEPSSAKYDKLLRLMEDFSSTRTLYFGVYGSGHEKRKVVPVARTAAAALLRQWKAKWESEEVPRLAAKKRKKMEHAEAAVQKSRETLRKKRRGLKEAEEALEKNEHRLLKLQEEEEEDKKDEAFLDISNLIPTQGVLREEVGLWDGGRFWKCRCDRRWDSSKEEWQCSSCKQIAPYMSMVY